MHLKRAASVMGEWRGQSKSGGYQLKQQEKSLSELISKNDALGLKHFLGSGVDPNAFSDTDTHRVFTRITTPLCETAGQGHLECVQVLIGAGADIHALDAENWNALHFAAYHSDSPEVCSLLIQMGIDASIETVGRQTALELAIERGNTGNIAMIEGFMKAQWERDQLQVCLISMDTKDTKLPQHTEKHRLEVLDLDAANDQTIHKEQHPAGQQGTYQERGCQNEPKHPSALPSRSGCRI